MATSNSEIDKIIFEVRASDVQEYAKSHLGRTLTEEELDRACDSVDEGLSCSTWITFDAAIQDATEEDFQDDEDEE